MNEIPDILLLILPSEKSMFHKLKMLFVTLRKWGAKVRQKTRGAKSLQGNKSDQDVEYTKKKFLEYLENERSK